MSEQAQTAGWDAARKRSGVHFACRHDDGVGLGDEPRLVHFAKIRNHGDDRDVLHARIGPRAQRGVIEQRMDGDDHVGLIGDEQIAQALAVERLAETDQRLVAAPAVGRIVERAVERRCVAQRQAVAQTELRHREGTVRGDVVDAVLERIGRLDLVERGRDRVCRAPVAAARIRDQEQCPFGQIALRCPMVAPRLALELAG